MYCALLCGVVWCGVRYFFCLYNCNSPYSTFLFFTCILLHFTLFHFSYIHFLSFSSLSFFFFNCLGGKRPFNSVKNIDRNPCFCLKPSKCILVATGKIKMFSVQFIWFFFFMFYYTITVSFHACFIILFNCYYDN